ncbi:MAG: hypothetical protein ACK502_04280 [Alphaproteobacteria bacterium]
MNLLKRTKYHKHLGFSLMQTSIALAVSAIVMSAVLPGGGVSDESAKLAITKQRMTAIEEATKKFMATNYRRPCPANGTLAPTDASFGAEATPTGTCTTGANFTTGNIALTGLMTSSMAAGIVPVRALGLPDEYALDGFGRRFMYVVDRNATSSTTCRNMQSVGTKGIVRVRNASTDTAAKDLVMAALISYGKDGHGAFPPGGSTVANRINTFSSDANSQMNAFVNSVATTMPSSFGTSSVIVKRESSGTFDDIVYYDESTKDKCCVGMNCNQGFRINGYARPIDITAGINYVAGDFDGDGNKDLAVSNHDYDSSSVSVFFSVNTGWPVGTAGTTLANEVEKNSIAWTIFNSNRLNYVGYSMAAGDVTGDNRDDLVILGEGVGFIIYQSPPYTTGVQELPLSTISDDDDYNMGIDITHSGTGKPGAIAIGDIDADGYKDIIFATEETPSASGINAGSEVAVIWGRDARDFSREFDIGSSDSFYLYSSGATLTVPLKFSSYLHSMATGNINGDVYADIVMGAPTIIPGFNALVSVFGRDRSSWASPHHNIEPDVFGGTNGFTLLDDSGGSNFGQSVAVADMNKDGLDDALSPSTTYILGFYGKSGAYTPLWDLATASFAGGALFAVDIIADRPPGATLNNDKTILNAADVNADGRPDIILSNSSAYMSNAANAGMTYVMFNPTTAMGYASNGFANFAGNAMFTATNNGYATFNGTKGFVIEGAAGDYASNAGVIDLNLDKKMDVVVAAPGYDHAITPATALYVIYGRNNTDWRSRYTAASATPANWPKIDLTDLNP